TVHAGDRAADEAGDPRRAAVPHARRLPHLRQHLHPDRRRSRYGLGVDPGLRQPVHVAQPRHRLRHLRADLHLRRDHRRPVHQGVRHGRTRFGPEVTNMASTTKQKVGWGVADIVIVIAALIPVLWIVSLSFKDPATITEATFLPRKWTLDNYRGIFQTSEFTRALVNSIGISLIATFVAVVFASMAAYAVARLRFPGKSVLIGMSLLIAMFPAISLVTPLFNIERNLGIFDTWLGLIIPYVTFGLPLAIYTLSAFFREIPWDLE